MPKKAPVCTENAAEGFCFECSELVAVFTAASALALLTFGSGAALRRQIAVILALAYHQQRMNGLAFNRRLFHRIGDFTVKLPRFAAPFKISCFTMSITACVTAQAATAYKYAFE